MSSPSMVRPTRSTPWVDGCCGPRLMNIWSVLSCFSGRTSGAALVIEAVLDVDVVLAQRVPDQEVRGEDLRQVGVPVELDAQEVEQLALLPVGALEESGQAGDAGVVARQLALDEDPGA